MYDEFFVKFEALQIYEISGTYCTTASIITNHAASCANEYTLCVYL